jgi:hypothetical protein
MSNYMPDRMSERMSECMSYKVPKCLPEDWSPTIRIKLERSQVKVQRYILS